MKKRILLTMPVIAGGLSAAMLTVCGEDKKEETLSTVTNGVTTESATSADTSSSAETSDSSTRGEHLYVNDDGVEINDVAIDLVGSTFNFSVIFANNTDKEHEFDCRKFDLKFNGKSLGAMLSTKTFPANQSYIQWAFPMSDTGDLKVGDKVDVYYDSTLLKTVEVTEF